MIKPCQEWDFYIVLLYIFLEEWFVFIYRCPTARCTLPNSRVYVAQRQGVRCAAVNNLACFLGKILNPWESFDPCFIISATWRIVRSVRHYIIEVQTDYAHRRTSAGKKDKWLLIVFSLLSPFFIGGFRQFVYDGVVYHLTVVHRGTHVLVAEQLLHRGHAHALSQQQRSVGVACRVEREALPYPCHAGYREQLFVNSRVWWQAEQRIRAVAIYINKV